MSLGHRDPFTFKKLPIGEWLPLNRHLLTMERLVREFQNEAAHQYLHELIQGKDPWESDWFKRLG